MDTYRHVSIFPLTKQFKNDNNISKTIYTEIVFNYNEFFLAYTGRL